MTCREKLQQEHPEKVSSCFIAGCAECPHTYGYAEKPYYCDIDDWERIQRYRKCWDREVEEREENEMKDDNVNHPSHYTQGGIECYKAIEASMTPEAYKGYLKGNVLKYVWRYEKKGSEIENLRKAEWYLKELIKEVENQ